MWLLVCRSYVWKCISMWTILRILSCVISWEKSMSDCAKKCVGVYVQGQGAPRADSNRMRSWDRALWANRLYTVSKRSHLWEVIPLLTTNLFRRAPPTCTQQRKGGREAEERVAIRGYIPGKLPQVSITETWVAEAERVRHLRQVEMLIEYRGGQIDVKIERTRCRDWQDQERANGNHISHHVENKRILLHCNKEQWKTENDEMLTWCWLLDWIKSEVMLSSPFRCFWDKFSVSTYTFLEYLVIIILPTISQTRMHTK